SWPRATLLSQNFGRMRLTLTAPALRLINCLLLIAIGLLLIQLELRQTHDQMNEPANFLVNGCVVVGEACRLPVVARFEVRSQRCECVTHVQRPDSGEELSRGLFAVPLGQALELIVSDKRPGIGSVAICRKTVCEVESFQHACRVNPAEVQVPT